MTGQNNHNNSRENHSNGLKKNVSSFADSHPFFGLFK
ncbi:MAG TPA: hypothetical protein ENH29_08615 [Bacteroidetes bacterium]|nr:hypothetical protein [Bacteroidota bacterium]